MKNFVLNDPVRIDIPIDYAKASEEELFQFDKLMNLGERQLNAPCNNRWGMIEYLESELASTAKWRLNRVADIRREIREHRDSIRDDKREGVFADYTNLKRRVRMGESADDLIFDMPYFYAKALKLSRKINSRDDHVRKTRLDAVHQWINTGIGLLGLAKDSIVGWIQ